MKFSYAAIFHLVVCFLLMVGRSFGLRHDDEYEGKNSVEYVSVEKTRGLKGNAFSRGKGYSKGKGYPKGKEYSKGKGHSEGCNEEGKSKKGQKSKKGSKGSKGSGPVRPPQATPSGCDPFNDTCPFKLDGFCEAYTPEYDPDGLCTGTKADCLDCDPCSAFHYTSCSNCTSQTGCFWCPGDALCYSTPMVEYPPDPMNPVYGPMSACTAEEDWLTLGSCPTTSSCNVYADPLYDGDDWAFKILNVQSLWRKGITGEGVRLRINDVGVDDNHPEFAGKFDIDASCDVYLPADATEFHGTTIASIAAARGDNNVCAVGIAPDATLSSCKIFGIGALQEGYSFLTHALQSQDVSINSWARTPCNYLPETGTLRMKDECPFLSGPDVSPCLECDFASEPLSENCTDAILRYCSNPYYYEQDLACIEYLELFTTCQFSGISLDLQAHLTMAIKEGRGGKGLIFVFPSSNENPQGSYSSFDGTQSSRFIISVGAVGKDGIHASYSTVGPSVLVSAPGGDIESRSNWITATPFGGCRDFGYGTSFATPATAGVAALILQVNPDLGWRDVQGIFATTSRMSDPEDASWVINGAGLHHAYKYGFGIVNAAAAVRAASTWEKYSAERMLWEKSGTANVQFDDIGTPIANAVTITGEMKVESVVVYLNISSSSFGHLDIRLSSPQGTESILAPGKRPANSRSERRMFRTVRSWGESSQGQWTLSIADTEPGDVSECIDVPFNETTDCARIYRSLAAIGKTVEQACTDATLNTACCFCGGGENASGVQDVLFSWTLIVYGRDLTGNLSQAVSTGPTSAEALSPAPTFLPASLPPFQGSPAVSPPPTMPLASGVQAGVASNIFAAAAHETEIITVVATETATSGNSASFTTPDDASGERSRSSGTGVFVHRFCLALIAWMTLLHVLV